ETATAHAQDPIAIGNRTAARDEAAGLLEEVLENLPQWVNQTRRVPLGLYRGLTFGLELHPHYPPDGSLEGKITRQHTPSRDHHGPRAILNALERLAGGYSGECNRVRQELGVAQSQLRDYQARMGAPFPHESYLARLTHLRDQLKAVLS